MPAGEAPANKTKTKKLIIFGFFLINIQTGPAGSSALEGEEKSFNLCFNFKEPNERKEGDRKGNREEGRNYKT